MALRFGVQTAISPEVIEDYFPVALSDMARKLLREARPDWDTVRITVEPGTLHRALWVVRLQCDGGTRDCIIRGGPDAPR